MFFNAQRRAVGRASFAGPYKRFAIFVYFNIENELAL
jgi:hypothetical protein